MTITKWYEVGVDIGDTTVTFFSSPDVQKCLDELVPVFASTFKHQTVFMDRWEIVDGIPVPRDKALIKFKGRW